MINLIRKELITSAVVPQLKKETSAVVAGNLTREKSLEDLVARAEVKGPTSARIMGLLWPGAGWNENYAGVEFFCSACFCLFLFVCVYI